MIRAITYNTPTGSVTTTTNGGGFSDVVMDLVGRALIAVVVGGFRVIWWAMLFPIISVPVLLSAAVGWWFGWPFGAGMVGASVAGIMLWRWKCPEMFERWLSGRIRSRWLTWFRYRRRWASVMRACSLTKSGGDTVEVPRLVSAHIGESLDTVRAKMLPGHSPADWENRADHIAHAFGTRHAAVAIVGPALVELTFRRRDSLSEPFAADFESVAGFKTLPTRKAA
ncbi:hypothetical protein [Nocardia asteroides]|uniref:hypothetical protein n=1 Tax=Nocardia asteroides TaxID=1824 RepID=UPI0036610A53